MLPERFGADALMVDVLEAISAAYLRNKEKHPGRRGQAYLPTCRTRSLPTCRPRRESGSELLREDVNTALRRNEAYDAPRNPRDRMHHQNPG